MRPKLSLGIAPIQQIALVQQITQAQQIACVQQAVQECTLCKQAISAKRQLQLSTILIERYSICPSCRQRVRREIELAYWYRRRWNHRVKAISKANGWDWKTFEV
jgi:hypothetical protein